VWHHPNDDTEHAKELNRQGLHVEHEQFGTHSPEGILKRPINIQINLKMHAWLRENTTSEGQ